jgi:hypothetical protein
MRYTARMIRPLCCCCCWMTVLLLPLLLVPLQFLFSSSSSSSTTTFVSAAAFAVDQRNPAKVLVTGAAGKTGRLVFEALLNDPAFEPIAVRRCIAFCMATTRALSSSLSLSLAKLCWYSVGSCATLTFFHPFFPFFPAVRVILDCLLMCFCWPAWCCFFFFCCYMMM